MCSHNHPSHACLDTPLSLTACHAVLSPLPSLAAATVAEGKAHMKARLQQRLGLRVDPHVPLMGFVGRLTEQKGVDVLLAAAPALLGGCASNVPAPSRWRAQPLPKTAEKVAAPGVAGKAPLLGAAILQAGAAAAGGNVRSSSFGTASDAAPSAAGVSNLPLSTCVAVPPEQGRSAEQAGMQIVVLGTGEVSTLVCWDCLCCFRCRAGPAWLIMRN